MGLRLAARRRRRHVLAWHAEQQLQASRRGASRGVMSALRHSQIVLLEINAVGHTLPCAVVNACRRGGERLQVDVARNEVGGDELGLWPCKRLRDGPETAAGSKLGMLAEDIPRVVLVRNMAQECSCGRVWDAHGAPLPHRRILTSSTVAGASLFSSRSMKVWRPPAMSYMVSCSRASRSSTGLSHPTLYTERTSPLSSKKTRFAPTAPVGRARSCHPGTVGV